MLTVAPELADRRLQSLLAAGVIAGAIFGGAGLSSAHSVGGVVLVGIALVCLIYPVAVLRFERLTVNDDRSVSARSLIKETTIAPGVIDALILRNDRLGRVRVFVDGDRAPVLDVSRMTLSDEQMVAVANALSVTTKRFTTD